MHPFGLFGVRFWMLSALFLCCDIAAERASRANIRSAEYAVIYDTKHTFRKFDLALFEAASAKGRHIEGASFWLAFSCKINPKWGPNGACDRRCCRTGFPDAFFLARAARSSVLERFGRDLGASRGAPGPFLPPAGALQNRCFYPPEPLRGGSGARGAF